jgi:nucleoside-diphosphate-sugar epimerase
MPSTKKAAETGRVMVTGGGGFLGSAIVKRLVAQGRPVRSFCRRFYSHLERWGVEQIQGDIADPNAVAKAFEGISTVFHTAAKPGVWGAYADYHAANVAGTENVLSACRTHGIECLVHTSSPSVIFDGGHMEGVDESVPYPSVYHTHYPRTKALAEQLVMAASRQGLKAIILRPHLIWGPYDNHLVPRILKRARRLRRVGDGTNRVDTIYIDNAAEAHLLAEKALIAKPHLSGRIYFISQDEPIPLWEMVDRLLTAGGCPKIKRSISAAAAMRIGTVMEWIYRTLKLKGEPQMTRFLAQELSTAHWFNIRAAREDLGYVPRVSTEEGLKRLEDWLVQRHEKQD